MIHSTGRKRALQKRKNVTGFLTFPFQTATIMISLIFFFSLAVVGVDSFRFSRHLQKARQRSRSISKQPFFDVGVSSSSCNGIRSISVRNHHKTSRTATTTTALQGSLVAPGNSWGNLATLSAVGVASQNLGKSTAIGRLLGAPVTAMAITFLLASIGVLSPGGTQASRSLQTLSIQFATPWILLGADFGGSTRAKKSDDNDSKNTSSSSSSPGGTVPLLFGFGLAALATLAGGIAGWGVAGRSLVHSALGHHNGLAIASALLAKNIGGGINYVAVCAALGAGPEAIATGLCVDNIGALVYFPISNLLASRYPDPVDESNKKSTDDGVTTESSNTNNSSNTPEAPSSPSESPGITVESISVAFFAASALLWMGDTLATKVLNSPSAQIPLVTLLAVVLAGIVAPLISGSKVSSVLPGGLRTTCDTLGTVALYLFFTTAGAPGIKVARSMSSALWPLSVFSVLLYAIHGSILGACYQLFWGESKLSRFRRKKTANTSGAPEESGRGGSRSWREVFAPQRLLVASSSAIGGPPTSVALARTVGWDSLVVPALLVGNVGYAVSTFIGIAFYYFFRVTP